MRTFVIVNHILEIGFRQTTALLIAALARSGQEVWLVDVDALSVSASADGATGFVRGVRLPSDTRTSERVDAFTKSDLEFSCQQIVAGDLVLIRTNPGRDTQRTQTHESFLHLCIALKPAGVRVVNAPEHLRYFASKSSLIGVAPAFRPAMIVTNQLEEMVNFVKAAPSDCVAKPLFGSRGENVIRVSKSMPDLAAKLESTFGADSLVVQQFVDADHPGDKRVVVAGGEILEVDGNIAGIERHPASDDFRANLHAGGSAHALKLSPGARAAAEYAAKLLHDHGIWLAGVDLIGDKIIEFNVFSTGGLFDSIQFSGVPFDDILVERLLTFCSN